MDLQLYNVSPRIPEELAFLETLANNIWWCWHRRAVELFVRIDPHLWRELSGNAKTYLRRVSQHRLEELAKEYQGHIVVYKVDVDRCREVAEAFGITSIPAVLYIPLEGEPSMTIGARNKSKFQNEIERILLDK